MAAPKVVYSYMCDHVCVHWHTQSANLQVLDPPTPAKSKISFVGEWVGGLMVIVVLVIRSIDFYRTSTVQLNYIFQQNSWAVDVLIKA